MSIITSPKRKALASIDLNKLDNIEHVKKKLDFSNDCTVLTDEISQINIDDIRANSKSIIDNVNKIFFKVEIDNDFMLFINTNCHYLFIKLIVLKLYLLFRQNNIGSFASKIKLFIIQNNLTPGIYEYINKNIDDNASFLDKLINRYIIDSDYFTIKDFEYRRIGSVDKIIRRIVINDNDLTNIKRLFGTKKSVESIITKYLINLYNKDPKYAHGSRLRDILIKNDYGYLLHKISSINMQSNFISIKKFLLENVIKDQTYSESNLIVDFENQKLIWKTINYKIHEINNITLDAYKGNELYYIIKYALDNRYTNIFIIYKDNINFNDQLKEIYSSNITREFEQNKKYSINTSDIINGILTGVVKIKLIRVQVPIITGNHVNPGLASNSLSHVTKGADDITIVILYNLLKNSSPTPQLLSGDENMFADYDECIKYSLPFIIESWEINSSGIITNTGINSIFLQSEDPGNLINTVNFAFINKDDLRQSKNLIKDYFNNTQTDKPFENFIISTKQLNENKKKVLHDDIYINYKQLNKPVVIKDIDEKDLNKNMEVEFKNENGDIVEGLTFYNKYVKYKSKYLRLKVKYLT